MDRFINKIICGDATDVLREMPDESVDLICVDPPYEKKYQYTYDILADECPRVMKRGASLLTIIGHFALPDILKKFDGKLKYRWICCMNQFSGQKAKLSMGVEIYWKPILWLVKDAFSKERQKRGWVNDGVIIPASHEAMGKSAHKWQQPMAWTDYYIERLTYPDEIVLDPFAGSGSALVSAQKLGRKFIGIDIDKDSCDIAMKRLGIEE